ncbi:L,D-transpeptidase family protein [Halomonas llamarensis]|uniref:L,D-transpeptidase family protein n=1 Tax=Halomonas llamarensis TaxID=2945104 RepID=A0ABT0SRD3_9GAMM|nr:L,D-transpeptidase family protein [Halomonas llamarensis]MCL7930035.1 L,D-transpeptidase family protein [Halomonas llamarensis]
MKKSANLLCRLPAALSILLTVSLASSLHAASHNEDTHHRTMADTAVEVAIIVAGEATSQRPNALPRGQFQLPTSGDVIGERYTITVENHEETLIDIARRHNIGFEEIRMANPEVSLWVPGEGTEVIIPSRYILPPVPRKGVVINLSELRLYYYPADNPGIVETYPVSVGREEFATPVGVTRTTIKVKDPAWAPPASMRREAAKRGDPAPAIVPPGPDNPLGEHAILLNMPSYLIHGTNRPDGVGMRVSRGCIRMYPEDIESLYERLPSGTKVNLIDTPFKAGWAEDGTLFVQSFPQLKENMDSFEPLLNALNQVSEKTEGDDITVDYAQIKRALEQSNGHMMALYGPQAPKKEPVRLKWDANFFDALKLEATAKVKSDA